MKACFHVLRLVSNDTPSRPVDAGAELSGFAFRAWPAGRLIEITLLDYVIDTPIAVAS